MVSATLEHPFPSENRLQTKNNGVFKPALLQNITSLLSGQVINCHISLNYKSFYSISDGEFENVT